MTAPGALFAAIAHRGWPASTIAEMKIASYIFYALTALSILAGISAASFAKEELGQIFGSGSLFFYGGIAVMFGVIGVVCARLAERRRY